MAIVGLDIATDTGVATWFSGGHAPVLQTLRLGGEPGVVGPAMERLRQFLAAAHEADVLTHIFIEKTILPRMTTQATVFKLNAYAGMAEWFGYRIGAVVRSVDQQDWRKHFFLEKAGKGSAAKKEAALRAARMRGWSPANDHEADAAGVLDYGLACFGIKPPWRDAHLMGGARILRGER
jgi:hypothetical protein